MEPAKLKPRVVIVDDNEDIVAYFVKAFSDEFEVIGVTAPEEALARVDGNVAVAVVDERMPRLSGVEVLSRLQAEKPEITRILRRLQPFSGGDQRGWHLPLLGEALA